MFEDTKGVITSRKSKEKITQWPQQMFEEEPLVEEESNEQSDPVKLPDEVCINLMMGVFEKSLKIPKG